MLIFDLTPFHPLGAAMARILGREPAGLELRDFRHGQHKARPLVRVRGAAVVLFATLQDGPGLSCNDLLIRLLFLAATCRDHGAARVTAVVPWLAYARKDRVTKDRDPVSSRYVAQLCEAVGLSEVVTVEVHNLAAFQNGFRCPTTHLDCHALFAAEVAARMSPLASVVLSPDAGGMKRAALLCGAVEQAAGRPVGMALMEKQRSGDVLQGRLLAGELRDREVWILDDMIETGATMLRAAQACKAQGAAKVHLLATHDLMTEDAAVRLADPAIDSVTVTDSVRVRSLDGLRGFRRLSVDRKSVV